MEQVAQNCVSGTRISPHKMPQVSRITKFVLLVTVLLWINNTLVKAQCSAVAPYICINTNPVASNVTTTTVDISGMVATSHWAWMQQVGVVFSTSSNPTLSSNMGIRLGTVTTSPNGGTMGAITITGLAPGTTYYLRAFGTYNNTTESATNYGAQITFTTLPAGPIAMTTTAASAIGPTSASTGGSVTILSGSPTITERGVVYSTTINPTTITGTKVISGAGTGSFTSNLTGLASSTTYYVRSYSIDNLGNVYYGSNETFTTSFQVSGIISPFSLSPAWYFGRGAVYTFPSGSFPAVPPGPTISSVSTNTSASVESSTSVSFRDGAVALYTNTMQAYNRGQTAQGTFIRNFASETPVTTCGGSATAGGVAFPDPANNATNDAFYLIIANDLTGGACANHGINRYRFTGTGTTVAYNAGALNMAGSDSSSEALTAGTDGAGGYWVVSHDQRSNNNFYVWHYTASGMSAPVRYTPATSAPVGITNSGGFLRFSPCMDKIAFAGFGGAISVYSFNKTTGVIGPEIAYKSPAGKYGLEFSPDGTKIYHSGQGTQVQWFLISNPATTGTVAGSNSWTMQMGPDAQIYTSGVGNSDIQAVGMISDPNSNSPGHTPMTLTGTGSVFRGLTNISWLSPQLPTINTVITDCTVDFSYLFQNYFNDDVTVKPGSYHWDFGDASSGTGPAPTHTYATGTNSWNVTLTFRDSCCNQLWTATTVVNTSCTILPVSLISFKGHQEPEGNVLYWATGSEKNNDFFEIMKSDDGINFYSIGKITGTNQASGISNYTFTDYSNNNKSVSYYYLVQYDQDGTATKSTIISIRSPFATPVVSPNPSSGNFTVSLPYDKAVTVTVLDMLGKTIETKTMTENTPFVIVGEYLSTGAYIISVVTEDNTFFYKVIKE